MKIKVTKRGGQFVADPVELAGGPVVGKGESITEALGDFLIHYQGQLGVSIEIDETAEQAERERRANALNQR